MQTIIQRMENKFSLHSTGNYMKYPVINIMEKIMKKNAYIYV